MFEKRVSQSERRIRNSHVTSMRTGTPLSSKSNCQVYIMLALESARTPKAHDNRFYVTVLILLTFPDPTHKTGKGLVTFLVVLCQQNARDYIRYSTSYAICVPRGCHMTADTAQPRKRSNVTRPFPVLWVGSGDETMLIQKSCERLQTLFRAGAREGLGTRLHSI